MSLPGFTAEAALYREKEVYQSEKDATLNQSSALVDVIQPAGFISYGICLMTCRGSRSYCRNVCFWLLGNIFLP